jgi:hypothetical protein
MRTHEELEDKIAFRKAWPVMVEKFKDAPGNLQYIHTPFTLCFEMVSKLSENIDLLDKKILTINVEFIEVLVYDFNVPRENIWFVADCIEESRISNYERFRGVHSIHVDLLTWEPNMKFDVVIGNPPYLRGLHAKMFEKAISLGENVIFLLPITSLKRCFSKYTNDKTYNIFSNTRFKSIQCIPNKKCKEIFPGLYIEGLGIVYSHKDGNFDIESLIDPVKLSIFNKTVLPCINKTQQSLFDYRNEKTSGNYKLELSVKRSGGNWFGFLNKDPFKPLKTKHGEGNLWFDTKEQRDNLIHLQTLPIYHYIVYIASTRHDLCGNRYPIYNLDIKWTEDSLEEYLNITKEEHDLIMLFEENKHHMVLGV